MNPARRFNWLLAFQELRAWIDTVAPAHPTAMAQARCSDCGNVLRLVQGRLSRKYFWTHVGLSQCENVRAVMFDTREQAEKTEAVFL